MPDPRARQPRNLVLVGFMGSGKTTVGRAAAKRLGLAFVDVDDAVVSASGMSIVDIFARHGEPDFRRRERAALRAALGGSGRVVAPGGGAVMNDDSWRMVRDGNLVVYLHASPRALLRRIRNREEVRNAGGARPANIRPLANVDPGSRHWPAAERERVMALFRQREPRYRQAARQVETTGVGRTAVVAAVVALARADGFGTPPGPAASP